MRSVLKTDALQHVHHGSKLKVENEEHIEEKYKPFKGGLVCAAFVSCYI